MKEREFIIADLNEKIIIQEMKKKDLLNSIDEHLQNIKLGIDMSDFAFYILYKDGSEDFVIENDYDEHKIKKINILAIVIDTPGDVMVFGNYSINEYGIVSPAAEMYLNKNITQNL